MIYEHYGNLFDMLPEFNANELNVIVHGCNAQGRMGSGFAKELRSRYPECYQSYIDAYEAGNNHLQLGSVVYHIDGTHLIICNAVTQEYYGKDGKKYVSYDALDDAMVDINKTIKLIKSLQGCSVAYLHFPKIGADLGGGDWDVISAIIDSRITNATKNLYIKN